MAGQFFYDPRPFYDVTADQKLAFLDDDTLNDLASICDYFSLVPKWIVAYCVGALVLLLWQLFNPGAKEPKFIESEYRVKEGKQVGGGGSNSMQKNKKNSNDHGDEHPQKEKVEEKSKIQTVELNVSLCCDSRVWQVKEAIEDVEGVEKVDCDQVSRKIWVKGSLKPDVVLKKVRKVRDDAELVVKKNQN